MKEALMGEQICCYNPNDLKPKGKPLMRRSELICCQELKKYEKFCEYILLP
jgi:hypothetical protein